MKNMNPEDLKRQLEAVKSQSSAQQQYYYNVRRKRTSEATAAFWPLTCSPRGFCVQASEMLKTQGNALVKCVCARRRTPQARCGARRVGDDCATVLSLKPPREQGGKVPGGGGEVPARKDEPRGGHDARRCAWRALLRGLH